MLPSLRDTSYASTVYAPGANGHVHGHSALHRCAGRQMYGPLHDHHATRVTDPHLDGGLEDDAGEGSPSRFVPETLFAWGSMTQTGASVVSAGARCRVQATGTVPHRMLRGAPSKSSFTPVPPEKAVAVQISCWTAALLSIGSFALTVAPDRSTVATPPETVTLRTPALAGHWLE